MSLNVSPAIVPPASLTTISPQALAFLCVMEDLRQRSTGASALLRALRLGDSAPELALVKDVQQQVYQLLDALMAGDAASVTLEAAGLANAAQAIAETLGDLRLRVAHEGA